MRRRLKPKTGFPLTKTTGDIARNRRFQKPSEISNAKRVRFDDAETDASSEGHEAAQSPKCGGPKTSEYAYFRKVKEGAVNGHFRALHKENERLKSYKICDLPRVTNKESEELDPGIKDHNLSNSGESAGPSGHKPFVSSPVSRYVESNEIRSKELTHKTKQRSSLLTEKSSLLTETATPVKQILISSRLNQATEKSEDECNEREIFYEKRKKLRQWVAHATSSEVGKLHGKRSDLVSALLSRLIPKGNENSVSSKENADITSESLTIYEPDNIAKGLPLSHKSDCHKELPKVSSERSSEIVLREWDRFDYGTSYCREEGDLQVTMDRCRRSSETVLREWDSFDSGFSFNYGKESDHQKTMDRCGRSSEIVLRELDSFHPEFPSNYYKESNLQNKTIDPDQHSSSRICNSYDTRRGYSFCLPFESFRSLGAFHFKDPDECGPIVGHGREEHYRNSLEWDFGLEKGRFDHGIRQDMCHRLANDWRQQGIVDNVLDTEGFCPSPLYPSCCLIKPLPNYVSTGCLMREVQPIFDDVKYGMVKPGPGQFSLSFPNSPKRITLAEDKNADNDLPYSNILSSYRDPRSPKKVWDCRPHSDNWWKYPSAPEFSTEDLPQGIPAWQFPQKDNDSYSLPLLKEAPAESYTSFSEGAFNHYPSTLHSPLDTFMNCPLLLNHASQDIHDQELCSDDYSNEMEYSRYM